MLKLCCRILIIEYVRTKNVENVFDITSAIFRVFQKPMFLESDKAQLIVMTVVQLHNYLIHSSTSHLLHATN